MAEIQQTHTGVALTEGTGDREDVLVPEGGALIANTQALLKRPTAEAPDNVDKYMVPGEVYSERLSVQNRSSDMDEYVRLTVRKYWATGAEGDGEAQAEHGHEHELLAPGTEHELHDAGDHMAGEDPASYEDHQRPPGGDEHPPEVRVPPPGEDRDGEHHGDDGDVLKDEHGKVEPALGGFGLRLLLEAAEHDGGGGQGGEEAVHHALLPRLAREHAEAHERADGQHHLRRAADEHGAFQAHEFFAGHFKADGEQQQDHADLRQQFDRVGVLDEP